MVRIVSPESGDDYFPSAGLPNGDLFGFYPRVARKWWRGDGGVGSMAGRPEDGHTFKRGLFEALLVVLSIPRVDGQSTGENSVLG